LRHTFRTRLADAGVDVVKIKELMGHASIVTTMRDTSTQPIKEKRGAITVLSEYRQQRRRKDGHKLDRFDQDYCQDPDDLEQLLIIYARDFAYDRLIRFRLSSRPRVGVFGEGNEMIEELEAGGAVDQSNDQSLSSEPGSTPDSLNQKRSCFWDLCKFRNTAQ
jgi:hypothetical protein